MISEIYKIIKLFLTIFGVIFILNKLFGQKMVDRYAFDIDSHLENGKTDTKRSPPPPKKESCAADVLKATEQ